MNIFYGYFSEISVFEGRMANVKWTLHSCRKQKGGNQKILRKAEKKLEWKCFTHRTINLWGKNTGKFIEVQALMDSNSL